MNHLTDQSVENAFNYLLQSEEAAARARGLRVYNEEYRKSLRAILRNESDAKTEGKKDDFAYSHPRYLAHLKDLRESVVQDEMHRAARKRCEIQCEMWRTASANRRVTP